jgi:hypothetical protein
MGCARYFPGWNRQRRTFQVRRAKAAALGGGNWLAISSTVICKPTGNFRLSRSIYNLREHTEMIKSLHCEIRDGLDGAAFEDKRH